MNIKTLNQKNYLKLKIKEKIKKRNAIVKDSKLLLLKKNFRNNQNYVLWKKQKIDNIIYFIWYKKITGSFFYVFLHKITWFLFLFFRELNFWIKITLLLLLLFLILLFTFYSILFSFNWYLLFILIFLIFPFIDYFKFKNFNSVKYKMKETWDNFSRYRKNIYWINSNYLVYNNKKLEDILKYDILLKNKIKEK